MKRSASDKRVFSSLREAPRRIGFRGQDGAMYTFTRVKKNGVAGILIERTDPGDLSRPPQSFFVPASELEDVSDALAAFLSS